LFKFFVQAYPPFPIGLDSNPFPALPAGRSDHDPTGGGPGGSNPFTETYESNPFPPC
jgi:hypothetical protein